MIELILRYLPVTQSSSFISRSFIIAFFCFDYVYAPPYGNNCWQLYLYIPVCTTLMGTYFLEESACSPFPYDHFRRHPSGYKLVDNVRTTLLIILLTATPIMREVDHPQPFPSKYHVRCGVT